MIFTEKELSTLTLIEFRRGFLRGLALGLGVMSLLFFLASVLSDHAHADSVLFASGGVSLSNSLDDEKAHAWAVDELIDDYKIPFDVGYLNEGHFPSSKRDGIFAQAVLQHHMTDRFVTAFQAGPYFNATTAPVSNTGYKDRYNAALISGFSLRYALTERLQLRGQWQHIITFTNKDSDVFLFGLGLHY